MHVPLLHKGLELVGHAVHEAPQCAGSVWMLTQFPPHTPWPDGQLVAHTVPLQV